MATNLQMNPARKQVIAKLLAAKAGQQCSPTPPPSAMAGQQAFAKGGKTKPAAKKSTKTKGK